jgi:hypothetical protein
MAKAVDLTGEVFELWTVIERLENRYENNRSYRYYKVLCVCGNTKDIRSENLTGGNSKSCGCLRSMTSQAHTILDDNDIKGKRFGRLIAVERDFSRLCRKNKTAYICKCDCGNIKRVESSNLLEHKKGHTRSCGCYNKERMKGNKYGKKK